MKKLGIVALVLLGIYVLLMIVFPSGSWNYKLTLVVETPEGIKTGSAVREVHGYTEPKIFPEQPSFHTSVKGEAVVVDLGERGVLFALLKGNDYNDYGYGIIYQEFPDNKDSVRERINYYAHLKSKKELAFDKIPMLVHFRDINDPKTVELVDPNDLEKTFGKGVRLVSAILEMTDDSVSTEVKKLLPWLDRIKGGYLDGQFAGGGPELSNILHGGDFERK